METKAQPQFRPEAEDCSVDLCHVNQFLRATVGVLNKPYTHKQTHRSHTHSCIQLLPGPLLLRLSSLFDNITHHLRFPVCTGHANYIIIPCLIVPAQLRRGRTFVRSVECGAYGIFQQKGSFLAATAKGEGKRVRSQLLVPTHFFSLFPSLLSIIMFFLRRWPVSISLDLPLRDNPISLLHMSSSNPPPPQLFSPHLTPRPL